MRLYYILLLSLLFTYAITAQHICTDVAPCLPDSQGMQGVYETDLRWPAGYTLRIKFLDKNTYYEDRVKKYAAEWLQYAHLKFVFVQEGAADIRIGFQPGRGSYSLIGTQSAALSLDADSGLAYGSREGRSMNFGWFTPDMSELEFRRIILHEFGHALGLLHEHMNPLAGISWNKEKLYAFYLQAQGWTPDMVERNIIARYAVTQTNERYDPLSIMHYPIDKAFTTNGFEVKLNCELSEQDKALIAFLYPGLPYPADLTAYRITDVFYDDKNWGVTLTRAFDGAPQEYFLQADFPYDKINNLLQSGYYITSASYGHGLWAIVMSKGTHYTHQYIRRSAAFPESDIQQAWARHYEVSHICFGQQTWLVVFSATNEFQHQIYDISSRFPEAKIQEWQALDYEISHLSYNNHLWTLVMSSHSGLEDQICLRSAVFPQDKILDYWYSGYNLASVVYAEDGFALLLNKGVHYQQQCYRTAPDFPASEVAHLWSQ